MGSVLVAEEDCFYLYMLDPHEEDDHRINGTLCGKAGVELETSGEMAQCADLGSVH